VELASTTILLTTKTLTQVGKNNNFTSRLNNFIGINR
jgi:hypothetical protein